MINKILTYNSIDEYGQHIIPVNTISDMCKTASPGYSADILNYVSSMKREPIFYYTLINSVGAEEVWGSNGNGDGFPRAGVSHKSFPSDMGTPEDYGYKTFEYYANFFKHHVNKPDSPKFGKIFFSYYNPITDRVELIVGLFVDKAKDIIDKIENGEDIAVSMGARVPYDICSICGNKAKTRAEYCIHASEYMNHIVDRNLAEQWSKQLRKIILPGTKVYVINDFPKFFDISYVYKGADKTAFILGKVARKFHNVDIQLSSELAEAYGINDDWFQKEAENKMATISKRSAIIKAIPGSSKPISISTAIQKALAERANNVISTQPFFHHSVLDDLAEKCSLSDIFSTMVMSGIHPKPLEFQRIVIMKAGNKSLADNLDKMNVVLFDSADKYKPLRKFVIDKNRFNDYVAYKLNDSNPLKMRSCFDELIIDRLFKLKPLIDFELSKTASSISNFSSALKIELDELCNTLGSIYADLKLQTNAKTYGDFQTVYNRKPWLISLLGGATLLSILNSHRDNDTLINTPAYKFENILYDPTFSGHVKAAAVDPRNLLGYTAVGATLGVPALMMANAYNAHSIKNKGIAPISDKTLEPKHFLAMAGGAGLGAGVISELNKKVHKI